MRFRSRLAGGALLAASAWLLGCGAKEAPLIATLTFKRDGTHYSGTVIRREGLSITITGAGGDTHTYLYSELSDIKYGAPEEPPSQPTTATQSSASGASGATNVAKTASQSPVGGGEIRLPPGTILPVASSGLLDSSFVPEHALALGTMDGDVKGADGRVLVPAGASVTFLVRERRVVSGRMQMEFELASADFNGHHYTVSSTKGGNEPGAVATFTGEQAGSPEARLRGENVHIDDHEQMKFKAENATVFTVSQ